MTAYEDAVVQASPVTLTLRLAQKTLVVHGLLERIATEREPVEIPGDGLHREYKPGPERLTLTVQVQSRELEDAALTPEGTHE